MTRAEIESAVKAEGFEPPATTTGLVILYNNLVTGFKLSRHLDRIEWFPDLLEKEYSTRRDLLKALQEDGKKITEKQFKEIDRKVNLALFDLPTAYWLVCKQLEKQETQKIKIGGNEDED